MNLFYTADDTSQESHLLSGDDTGVSHARLDYLSSVSGAHMMLGEIWR